MFVFLFFYVSLLTCQIHFLSFQEHHVTANTSGTAGMVVFSSCLEKDMEKGTIEGRKVGIKEILKSKKVGKEKKKQKDVKNKKGRETNRM